jgi:hypothetical protein
MKYQPIETAPKDDTPILTYDANNNAYAVCLWDEGVWREHWSGYIHTPTHWMYIPLYIKPPK